MESLPKAIRIHNEILQNTSGVDFASLRGVVPKNSKLRRVTVIAGKGTSTILRDETRLINFYGGNINSWQKKSGIVSAENFDYEIHYYELNGKQYETKTKGVKSRK